MRARNAILTLVLAATGGCATMFPSDSIHEQAALRNVKERTSFDLGCEDASLARLGDVARLGQQMTRMNIGAKCGDKKATYTVTCVSNMGKISCTPEMNTVVEPE